MSDAEIKASLAQTVRQLNTFVESDLTIPDPNAGFAHYLRATGHERPTEAYVTPPWPARTPLRHPQELACFGYLVAIDVHYEPNLQSVWLESCDKILNRDAFPIDRQSFAFRPIEVLGIAHGLAAHSSTDNLHDSFQEVLRNCQTKGNVDKWSQLLYWTAAKTIGLANYPLPMLAAGECDLHEAALIAWLSTQFTEPQPLSDELIREAEARVIRDCSIGKFTLTNVGQVALLSVSLARCILDRIDVQLSRTAIVSASSQHAIEAVTTICRRFPLFARQLQMRRRDIKGETPKKRLPRPTIEMKDEYDVQDSLHAILRLFFDDIRPEPWTPDYGGSQNRVDFLLPQEEIVIEVKHTGSRLTQRDVAEQLIIDERYYRRMESCKRLVCLVYDPDLRCKNPVALETDLSKQEDDFTLIVIVCPRGA